MHSSIVLCVGVLVCFLVCRSEAFSHGFIAVSRMARLQMSSWTGPSIPSSSGAVDGKVYLIVPFDEKDMAKQMGARWDPEAKLWYALADDDSGLLQRWPAVGSTGSSGNRQIEQSLSVDSKAYLTVPFSEKDEAKALGARWDKDSKMWFAPNNEPALVQRWGATASGKSNSSPAAYSPSQPRAVAAEEPVAQKSWKVMSPEVNDRIYLDVPYEEKDDAKAMGARFCRDRKLWYTTDRHSPLLERWNMKDERRMRQNVNHLIPESFDDVEKYTFDDAQ